MATKHSLPRNFNEAVTFDDLKWQLGEFVSRIEDYLDSKIDIYVFQSRTTKRPRPTFKVGDLVFDFTISPGIATLQQWNGTRLVSLGFASLVGPLPQVHNEIPAGAIDGVNVVYTTAEKYALGTTLLFINGVRQKLGVDYTESTDQKTITLLTYVLSLVGIDDEITIDYNTQ